MSVAAPDQKSRGLGPAIGIAVGVAVAAALTWPGMQLVPLPGLDHSWVAALHMAAYHHLHWGSDISFTYGPLGFLSSPTVHETPTALLAWAYGGAVHIALTAMIVVALRRWLRPVIAVVVAMPVVGLGLVEPAELAVVVAAVAALIWVQSDSRSSDRLIAVGLGSLAGLQLLVKFNTGAAIVALAGFAAVSRGVRTATLFGVATLGTGVLLWFASWQRLGDLPAFLRQSIAFASGYGGAMAYEEPARHREYIWAAIVFVVVISALALAVHRKGRAGLPLACIALGFLYLEWRRGFVRHDAHSWAFFFAALVIPTAIRWSVRRALIGTATIVVLAAFMVGSLGSHLARVALSPRTSLRSLRTQTTTLLDRNRRIAARRAGRDAIRTADPLSPAILDAVRPPVHIDPFETAIVWGYGLPWKPVPVFQTYSAFTTTLDDLNARALAGRRAPATILRPTRPSAIDGRHPAFESPAYMLALECHYQVVLNHDGWEVLRHRANRCGRPHQLARISVTPGERVTVPAAPDAHSLVVARLTLSTTFADALRELLFRPARIPYFVDASGAFRFVSATGPDQHLLRIPAPDDLTGGEQGASLNIDWFEMRGTSGRIHVEFESISILP